MVAARKVQFCGLKNFSPASELKVLSRGILGRLCGKWNVFGKELKGIEYQIVLLFFAGKNWTWAAYCNGWLASCS